MATLNISKHMQLTRAFLFNFLWQCFRVENTASYVVADTALNFPS